MKKNALNLICIGLIIVASIISCTNGNTPSETALDATSPIVFTIDGTEYETEASYDFGFVDPDSTGITKTITLKNTGDNEITVTSITLSDDVNYSLTIPALPSTTAVDGTAEVVLTFRPQGSGDLNATVSIQVDGIDDPFVLNLTGEGNYAPTVKFGIKVSGAGTDNANGFYERLGFKNLYPYYETTTIPKYYCFYKDPNTGWVVSSSIDTLPEYSVLDDVRDPMVPPTSGWVIASGDSPAPSLTLHDIAETENAVELPLTANYLYSDAEGDAEASTTYQWYNSSDGENFTEISGATSKIYESVSSKSEYNPPESE
jgi:hypothetical protein